MANEAGFWIRLGARIFDLIIIGIIIFLFIAIFSLNTQSRAVQSFEGPFSLLYYVLLPVIWTGYTLGKRALGIRIINEDDSDVSFIQMIIRDFLTPILYGITFGILAVVSAVMIGVRENKKAIHDIFAKTKVIYSK
ncbi:RDD family protein [Salinicoccus sp. YB14-2]|uniref:RDD family protein n=1 Tax=Salinicoccus sp. YB14-2 TaxID=1572701 RepID=UPI00068CF179|nr:RDD family protein [Salinicoccus sp. YB14-2]